MFLRRRRRHELWHDLFAAGHDLRPSFLQHGSERGVILEWWKRRVLRQLVTGINPFIGFMLNLLMWANTFRNVHLRTDLVVHTYAVLNQVSTKYCDYSDSGIRESKANEIRVQVYIVQYVRARVCLRAQACVCTRVCRPLLRRKSLAVATLWNRRFYYVPFEWATHCSFSFILILTKKHSFTVRACKTWACPSNGPTITWNWREHCPLIIHLSIPKRVAYAPGNYQLAFLKTRFGEISRI